MGVDCIQLHYGRI